MTSLKAVSYRPRVSNRRVYDKLYKIYRQLHDAFGGVEKNANLGGVMKELLAIKEKSHT